MERSCCYRFFDTFDYLQVSSSPWNSQPRFSKARKLGQTCLCSALPGFAQAQSYKYGVERSKPQSPVMTSKHHIWQYPAPPNTQHTFKQPLLLPPPSLAIIILATTEIRRGWRENTKKIINPSKPNNTNRRETISKTKSSSGNAFKTWKVLTNPSSYIFDKFFTRHF